MANFEKSSLRPDILERTHILHEILDHVDEYASRFDKVDFSALKDEVLKPVLAETFDPETQIRGFLKTFRHTPVYEAAFAKITDPHLKRQINGFIEGKRSKDVVGKHGFSVLTHPSPPVVRHFSLLKELKKLVLCGSDIKEAVENVRHPRHQHVKGLPIVYEEANDGQVVEVCQRVQCET